MDKQYCTVEDIRNYSNITIDVADEPQVEEWIEAMSNYVSLETNREWLADSTASDRYYTGNGYQSLEVDEFIEVSNVYTGDAFGEDFVEKTSYITYPYNTTVKDTIILQGDFFPALVKSVKITAKWGYSATVPEDIKTAVMILVTGILLDQSNQSGEIKSEKIGNYSVAYETQTKDNDLEKAKSIINSRKRIRI